MRTVEDLEARGRSDSMKNFMNRRIKMKKLKQENERLRALLDQVTTPGLSVISHNYQAIPLTSDYIGDESISEIAEDTIIKTLADSIREYVVFSTPVPAKPFGENMYRYRGSLMILIPKN